MKIKFFVCLIICPLLFAMILSPKLFFGCQNFCHAETFAMQTNSLYTILPTEVKITSNTTKIFETADIHSTVLATARYNDKFAVLDIEENFYKIQFGEEQEGFVLTAFSMDSSKMPLEVFLDTNAVLIAESELYILNGSQLLLVNNLYLPAETRIKLVNGFNEISEYTKASVSINGETFYYYILTENIDPDGISTRTIIALMLIVTTVTIFLILYSFFKGKKAK
ncbi:MAG: hypothetical protein PHQ62_01335 [Clostridia bacterium]|nr:hypothetical protein [Clostridia bacterium]